MTYGDKVEIINYGHAIWQTKSSYKEEFKAGFRSKEIPDNIIKEEENIYWIDINPNLVGKKGIINNISKNSYGLELEDGNRISWFSKKQLKKI